ncbi:caspase family protein [Alkalihalobacillus sp. MEB130]|nr:hypothetical protein [Alkalihalobacillus sp. MEB130]MDT8861463.1 caspase family protein [Alkalihalobacillus sp. MEB130]
MLMKQTLDELKFEVEEKLNRKLTKEEIIFLTWLQEKVDEEKDLS